jgi:hypothetical protein
MLKQTILIQFINLLLKTQLEKCVNISLNNRFVLLLNDAFNEKKKWIPVKNNYRPSDTGFIQKIQIFLSFFLLLLLCWVGVYWSTMYQIYHTWMPFPFTALLRTSLPIDCFLQKKPATNLHWCSFPSIGL